MLRKSGSQGHLILVDKPGWLFYFGIFFILIGLLSAISSVFTMPPETEVPTLDRLITAAVGVMAAAGGAYFVMNSPRSQVVVNDGGRKLIVSRTGFQLREHETYKKADIEDIYVIERDDPGNAQAYSLRMLHRNGTEIPLSLNWFKERLLLEENAELLRNQLSLKDSD